MRYTDEEFNQIKELYMKGWSTARISEHPTINRSRDALWMKLSREDVKRPRPTYNTHYRCRVHSWVLPEDAVTVNKLLCCPICTRVLRWKMRSHQT